MSKFPLPQNEKGRLRALDNYQILDTIAEHDFDRITELASLICEVPISMVSLVDEKRQWFKSTVGLDVRETSRDLAFCQYAIMEPDTFVVQDATKDIRFKDNALVTGKPDIRFYAGYPLVDPEGYALGTLCVIDRTPRVLSEKQTRALELLGQEVIALIIERRQKQELKYFEKLFEESNDLVFVGGLDGYLKRINPAFEKVLGWSSEYLLNTSASELYHPDDTEATKKELEKLSQGFTTVNFKQRVKTINGDYKTIEWTSTPEPETGNLFGIGRDVTELIKKDEQIAFSEKMLEQTNKVARVGGWEVDIEHQKVYWTSITKELHGVPLDTEPDLTKALDFYKEGESRDKLTKAFDQCINEGKPYDLELQFVNLQGKESWVRAIGTPEMEKGVCKRIFGTFQDIDEKKRAELEVSRSKKLLDDVLNAATEVCIIAADKKGKITVFNTGAEVILGYFAEEIIGHKLFDSIYLSEELKERGEELTRQFGYPVEGLRVLVQIPETGKPEQHDWTFTKKDGSQCIVSMVISALRDINNNITGYVGVGRDITARKKAEAALAVEKARLTAFVEHAPAAVAMLDNNMNYIAVSKRWLDDYHLTGRDIIGLSHYKVFPHIGNESKERYKRILNGAIEKKDEDSYKLVGSENEDYIAWEMRPWYKFNGEIGGIMIFTQNIASIIKQREELKVAKLLAEEASVAKSEFLANMSHEIRTPLNGVVGFTDLVLKTQLNETQQQYLSIVNQSANALLSIINDILDFSKIEAGKLELDIEKADLYQIGSQATDIITYQIQKKGLEMLLNISPDLPRFIWADTVRLKQILINLLGNATKFTEKGEIELKIEALSSKGDETTIRFGVRDTGIGIKPEKQDKIFDAFSQEDSSTTKKYGGTGLGLTISNKLLGLMGSKLQLTSIPGYGSFFYFDITLKTEPGEPIEWDNIDLIKKILLVDDNDNNRLILKQMLLLKNIQTIEAKNGLEALQVLAAGERFDVILMDYHMPYMDGLETIKKIRQSFDNKTADQTIVLLHSSADDEKIIKDGERLKVSKRLVKPIKLQDIYNTLSTLHAKASVSPAPGDERDIEATTNTINILVVEDNPVNMLLAKTILKRIAPNAAITGAANGIEGVEAFKAKTPDIILMDVQMPEMNGYEATHAIRELETGTRVPIIALTAGNVKSERERCIDAGMDDFIVKPVVEETIALVLKKWLKAGHEHTGAETESTYEGLPHFDLNSLVALFGDEDILGEFLSLIRSELTQSIPKLEAGIGDNNLQGIAAVAHKLRGTALSAGMDVLAAIAYKLEHTEKFDQDRITHLVSQVKEEVNLILEMMGAAG